jgi:hypothetical protein
MWVYNSRHRFLHGYRTFNYVLLLRLYMGESFVNNSYLEGQYNTVVAKQDVHSKQSWC